MKILFFEKTANQKSEGSILIVAIMMLVILTLIGIAATTTSDLESQVSTNDLFAKKAFYNTESGENVAAQMLWISIRDSQAPASAKIDYGTEGGTAALFLSEAFVKGSHDAAVDASITLPEGRADIDLARTDTITEEGNSDEWGAFQAAFAVYDVHAQGSSHRGATFQVDAGLQVLIPAPMQ